jgi:hypothetical protein
LFSMKAMPTIKSLNPPFIKPLPSLTVDALSYSAASDMPNPWDSNAFGLFKTISPLTQSQSSQPTPPSQTAPAPHSASNDYDAASKSLDQLPRPCPTSNHSPHHYHTGFTFVGWLRHARQLCHLRQLCRGGCTT